MNFRFSLKYFILTLLILMVEVIIATVLKDVFFVRAFLGDVLVVILLYTFVLSFFSIKNRRKLIAAIFFFSVFVEILQHFKTADLLGLKQGSTLHMMLGNSFSWIDILCYALGCAVIFILDRSYLPK